MRNIYTTVFLSLTFNLAIGQTKPNESGITMKSALPMLANINHYTAPASNRAGGGAIWSEDFDGAVNTLDSVYGTGGVWGKSGLNGQVWKKSTTPSNGCWSGGSVMPLTSTANNGFLIFDADSANCVDPNSNPPVFNQDALLGTITSPVIDLSAIPAAVLSFEYESRWCCAGAGLLTLVEFSGDGGATWPLALEVEHNIVNEQQNGIFEANVTNVMGGAAEAMFRISWDIESHYYFVVDDIMITSAPVADTKILSAYVSHNGTGEEYGRVPSNQTGQSMLIGAEVVNFGATQQDNLELNADFAGSTAFAGMATQSMLAIGDTTFLEDFDVTTALAPGDYIGTYTVTSDTDIPGGPAFSNNTLIREFKVDDNKYSIDGIGVYSNVEITDLGTNSFQGGEDGFMMMSYYDVTEPLEVYGIEILLGPNTSADGELIVSLHDTIDIYADNVLDPLVQSDVHVLSNSEVDSGLVTVMFDEPYELSGDAFYAAVEMFSDGNTNNIEILDDLTLPQPGYSSMIYIPNDQVYSNGNAAAIRLVLCNNGNITSASSCDSYDWNGSTYTSSGIYYYADPTGDCGTFLDLTIVDGGTTFLDYDLCAGEGINVGGTTYSATGQYTQVQTASNGCDSTINVDVFIEAEPSTSILGNVAISPNSSETYAIVQPGGYTITWSVTNGTILTGQGSNSIDVFWDATGGGEVTVTLSNGNCTYTYTLAVGTFVGIENHWINDLQIHPNPSNGLFNIQLLEATQITVMDSRGRMVIETTENGRFTLDLASYPTGTYTLQLQTETGFDTKRLIKH